MGGGRLGDGGESVGQWEKDGWMMEGNRWGDGRRTVRRRSGDGGTTEWTSARHQEGDGEMVIGRRVEISRA